MSSDRKPVKILGLLFLFLTLGFLIIGCAGPAEEGAINSTDRHRTPEIPAVIDPASRTLTLGDGSGAATLVVDSHTVEVLTGSTVSDGGNCVSDGADNTQCWVRLYNRDADEYMANAFISFTECKSCDSTNHVMENFDAVGIEDCWDDATQSPVLLDACTAHAPTTTDGVNSGAPVPIMNDSGAGGAIAYVTDTFYPEIKAYPYNPWGAPMQVLQSVPIPIKPKWMIAPACGMVSQMWYFGGTDPTSLFPFFITVKSAWFQMNPFGDNGIVGGDNDDPRFDFELFPTWYIIATDLSTDDAKDTAWQKMYRPGSIYRSNVLAGYKPDWAKAAPTWAPGKSTFEFDYSGGQRYFAVNVGLDAANRLERQTMGVRSQLVYEYYQQIATLISWNNRVIQRTEGYASWLRTGPGGSYFQRKATPLCVNQAGCDDNLNSSFGTDLRFDQPSVATDPRGVDVPNAGYVGVVNRYPSQSGVYWSYFATGETYQYVPMDGSADQWDTITIGPVEPGNQRNIPKTFGIRGFTKIRCMTNNDTSCITQDGPDPDPEFWLFQVVFKAQDQVGLGSEIKIETHAQYTATIYRRTIPGADTFDSQSPHPTDSSTNAGPLRDRTVYSNVVDGVTITRFGNSGSVEFGNPKIRHRGPAKSTTHQAWNISVCIK